MNILMLLKSELRRSAGVLTGIAFLLALSLSLTVSTGLTERMLRTSSAAAADRFDILIGAKGSSTSLLLGTVYLRDEPLSLIPVSALAELDEKHGVRWAAPVAFGDRAGNSVLVGTTRDLVTFGGTLAVTEGRVFNAPDEIVAGAESGRKIGDKITPMHGRTEGTGHAHEHHALTVVGILPPTGTPWDRALLMPIETVWRVHSPAADAYLDQLAEEAAPAAGKKPPIELWKKGDLAGLPGLSAIVAKPIKLSDAYRIRQTYSQQSLPDSSGKPVNLMAVFSGEVLVSLYSTMGNASKALGILSQLTLAIALTATLIMGILLGELRRPTLLQLRVMGAPRRYIAALVWSVILTVVLAGTAGGLLLGRLFAEAAALFLTAESGIAMRPAFECREALLALTTTAVGAGCALLPAWLAGRARIS